MSGRPALLCLALAIFIGAALPAVAAPGRPNVVYIISDDHDYEHLGFMGNDFVQTPTLDRLARAGSVFTTAHLPMSRCHPTLASFLSGRWPHQSGIYYNYGTQKLSPKNSLPNLLKQAGYATYVEGKYWEGDPREMGFTHGAGKTAKTFVRKGQDDLFAFLDETSGKQPFFVWWAPLIPHTPHNPPKKYLDQYDWSKMPVPSYVENAGQQAGEGKKPQGKKGAKGKKANSDAGTWKNKEKLSYAMEAWLDDGATQLVEKLRSTGQLDNTMFVFVIDNGWCNGLPSKGSPFEKGVRTPIFFSLPGTIAGGQRFDGLVSTNDIYPTILDYAGVGVPESAAGRSLRPVIEGRKIDGPKRGELNWPLRDALFGAIYPAFATKDDQRPERDVYALYVRTDNWKYIWFLQDVDASRNGNYFRIQSITTDYPTRKAGDEDLYAIGTDPYEQNNLADDPKHAKLKQQLRTRCLAWWKETGGGKLPLE